MSAEGRAVVRPAEAAGPGPAPAPGRVWPAGLVLCLLAIGLRILVASRREGIEIDGMTYLANAQALRGNWGAIDVLHPPLYSVLLAPFLGLWRDPEWGARVISSVLGGLWVWPTLWLARQTTEERVAWTAGLLVAFMPAGVEASTRVLSEATFGLCLTAFLAALARALRTAALRDAGLAGLLGGLATLARPEGMGYLLLAWGALLLAPRAAGAPWTGRRALAGIGAVTALWLLILAPYVTLVRLETGQWTWSGKLGITLAWSETVGDARPAVAIDRFLTEMRPGELPRGLLGYVAARPGEAARRVLINLHHLDKYVLPGLLQSGGLAVVVLGLVHLRFRRAPAPPEWFLAAAPLPLAGLLLFLVGPRYFVSAIPLLSIIAAIGLARVGRRQEGNASREPSALGRVLLAVVLLSFLPWIARPWFRPDAAGVEKAAGLWLRQVAGPGAVFIGRHPRIRYYGEAREIPLGWRPLDDVLAEGRRAGARFLIVDNINLPDLRPDLLPLIGGDPGSHRDLELAHVAEDRSGDRVVIYRIRGPGNPS